MLAEWTVKRVCEDAHFPFESRIDDCILTHLRDAKAVLGRNAKRVIIVVHAIQILLRYSGDSFAH